MTVIEFAEHRLQDEIKENDHGAENGHLLAYWAAYLDGARAQKKDAADAIEALQAQLPKQGEWIWDDKRCIYVCSVCGSQKVRENMDRQIIKEQAYCYSCGAKMEVQDA